MGPEHLANGSAAARWDSLETALPLVYVADFDRRGTLRYVSRIVHDWTGHEPVEFLADDTLWYQCVHPEDVDRVRAAEARAFETKAQIDIEYRLLGPDGAARLVWERDVLVRDANGEPLCSHGTIVDLANVAAGGQISDPVAEGHAAILVRHDLLTGLPRRVLLTEHLELAIARATRGGRAVALLDIDLDDFGRVNDTLGHAAGDVLLALVARRLRACTRAGDLLAHHAGDEFQLMLSDLDSDSAVLAAQSAAHRLGAALTQSFTVTGHELHITTSVGFAIGPEDAADAESLQRAAHTAASSAKAAGRAEVHRYAAETADPLRRLSLDFRLHRAIERGEIVPHYQPIVDLASGAVCAVEALARWDGAEYGLLGADEFIPVAEESAMIVELDTHMFRLSCAQLGAWQRSGRRLRMHVNLSARQLCAPGFLVLVETALAENGIAPGDVVLELTETTAMRSSQVSAYALRSLHDTGVLLAIDDFGAGYSSLARLATLPVAVLKVDRQFLEAATAGSSAGATSVLDAVLRLGRSLGLMTVVEGVETPAGRELATELAADTAQGFFFGQPVPAVELERLLDAR